MTKRRKALIAPADYSPVSRPNPLRGDLSNHFVQMEGIYLINCNRLNNA